MSIVHKTPKDSFAEIASALGRVLVLCDDFAASVHESLARLEAENKDLRERLAKLEVKKDG